MWNVMCDCPDQMLFFCRDMPPRRLLVFIAWELRSNDVSPPRFICCHFIYSVDLFIPKIFSDLVSVQCVSVIDSRSSEMKSVIFNN